MDHAWFAVLRSPCPPVRQGLVPNALGDSEAAAATVDVVDVPRHVAAVARLRRRCTGGSLQISELGMGYLTSIYVIYHHFMSMIIWTCAT